VPQDYDASSATPWALHYDKLITDYRKSQFDVISYQTGLESVEARLLVYQQNEPAFEQDIKLLKLEFQLRDNALITLRQNLEKAKQERDELKLKLEKFQASSKTLSELLASQTNDKTGVSYNSQVFTRVMFDCDDYLSSGSDESFPPSPIYDRHVVPAAVLTPSKLVPITVVSPLTTVVPKTSVARPIQSKTIIIKPNSPPRRHINHSPSLKASTFPSKAPAVKASMVNVAQVVLGIWESKPKCPILDHGNPQHALKDKSVINSGCSRNMIRNMSYFSDFEELNGGYVTFGRNPKGGKIFRKGKIKTGKLDFDDVYFVMELMFNLFSVSQMCDKKNSVLFTDTECLVLSLDFKLSDENEVLLRVLRENSDLVRGLPTKVFENDNTCVACKKGKQHRASCKTKPVSFVNQPLYRLHMDLFGPTFVKSLDKKNYCLVVTDDYSRFTWVFFLAIKDETSPILKTFITGLENQLSLKNKVLLTKPHNKSLYELLHGRTPSIGFIRPFGCPVTILNTLDSLGKFDGKVDEGFLVGYSVSSKAFRVFNSRTREESDQQYVLFPVWSSGSTNPQNTNGNAAFDEKEPEFEGRKTESEVNVSPSSSAQSKKHNDKTKREAKGKSPVESLTRYKNLSAEFEDLFDNNINKDNAAGILVPVVRQFSSNSPNTFSVASPLNAVASPTHGKSSYVKSAFLYGTIEEKVCVCQPLRFEDLDHPNKVYKVVKALSGLHQVPRSWYELWPIIFLENGFQRGKIDQTLFIKRQKSDILLVQIYVDDIIFGSTNKDLCKAFGKLMKEKFQMSLIGELTFFLGLQVKQKEDGIFISQDKYVAEILRKFGLTDGKSASTPIDTKKHLLKDPDGEDKCKKQTVVATASTEAGSIKYALTINPNIYVSCIKQFWTTVAVKKVNDVTRLQALVDKKKEIFTELARMGYEKPFTKLTFYKAFFSSQWKFLIHIILQCMIAKRMSWNDFSSFMASAVICLSTGKGFSGVDTPLFEGMLVVQEVDGGDADEVHLKIVEHLEQDKVAQALEITKLKQRVKKLQKKNKDVVLEDAKDVADVEEMDVVPTANIITEVVIAASTTIIAADASIPAATIATAPTLTAAPSRRRKGVVIRDPEETTTTSIIIHSEANSKDKGKRILVEEPKPLKNQAQIKQDEKYARELEAELNKNIDWDEVIDHVHKKAKEDNDVKRYQALKRKPQTQAQARKNMMIYLKNVAGFKMDYFKGMSYDDIRLIFEQKFNSNVDFLLKTKEQIDEEESRALKRLNESQEDKALKKQKLDDEIITFYNTVDFAGREEISTHKASGVDSLTLNSLYDEGAYRASQQPVYGLPALNQFGAASPFGMYAPAVKRGFTNLIVN
nr:copia protein [Tanacetum cinerariifolium]